MIPINEEMIERYVQYPDTLSETERSEVNAFLEENALVRRIAAFYQDYYRELGASARTESPAVKSFVESLLASLQGKKPGKSRDSEENRVIDS